MGRTTQTAQGGGPGNEVSDRLRFAHEFHPVVAYSDAIGNDAFEPQRVFWASGVRSDLFAWEAKPEVHGLVRDWKDLERVTSRDGLLPGPPLDGQRCRLRRWALGL